MTYQKAKYGAYGKVRKISVSIPEGLVEMCDKLAADAEWGGPDTRSGQMAHLLIVGIEAHEAEHGALG